MEHSITNINFFEPLTIYIENPHDLPKAILKKNPKATSGGMWYEGFINRTDKISKKQTNEDFCLAGLKSKKDIKWVTYKNSKTKETSDIKLLWMDNEIFWIIEDYSA